MRYTEIEDNFFIPVNDNKNINHELDGSKLPEWFYEKYQELIYLIPKIKEMFLKLSLDRYYNKNNRQYDKGYLEFLFKKYKKEYLKVSDDLKENSTLLEIKNSIQYWGNILDFIFMIDNTLFEKEYFIYMMQLYNSALIDIGEIDGSLAKAYLSNQWLLTSKGYLYNMRSTAHEAGDYYKSYYKEKTKWFLTKTEPYISKKKPTPGKIDILPEFRNSSIILERGYITETLLDLLLHYINYYHFNGKVYDSRIIMTVMGVIELRCDLLDFFEKLDLYTVSPKDSFRRIIEITNGNYLDTLIRCCGVSKIASSPYKTIVTSRPTVKDEFSEYLEKGYNICFVPPIIINKETGTVEELSMDSPIVSAYIKNEIIRESELDRGKVYTNHLKF